VDIASGRVELAADVAPANHSRARFNMMLALMVILLLMLFVVTLNFTIWKVGRQAGSCGLGGWK
jgi:Ca2+/Na+ antiporter